MKKNKEEFFTKRTDYLALIILTFISAIPTILFLTYNEPEELTKYYSTREQSAAVSDFNDSLVAYYPFDGNANDEQGSHNGTLKGGTQFTDGRLEQAVLFDSSDDYIDLGPNLLANSTAFTVSAWIRFDSEKSNVGILGKSKSPSGFRMYVTGSGRVDCYIDSNSASTAGVSSLKEGSWYHLVCTWDGSELKGYSGGKKGATKAVTTIKETDSNFWVGKQLYADAFLGAIDELRIYNKALSQSEIDDLFVLGSVDNLSPVISAGNPGGTQFGSTVTLSVKTDERSTCRYDTNSDTPYSSMSKTFSTTGDTFHSSQINGLSIGSHTYYVKCSDLSGNDTKEDYDISFALAEFEQPEDSNYVCGNDKTEPGEVCDGSDVNGLTCSSAVPGYTSGSLRCRSDCRGYTFTQCKAGGETIVAQSCNQADVQAAIDSASHGDIVFIPEGTCTWSSSSGPAVRLTKGIVLKGAGIDKTVILDETDNKPSTPAIQASAGADRPFRITNFTLKRWRTNESWSSTEATGIRVFGSGDNWRIDHMKFVTYSSDAIIYVGSNNRGIMDNIQAYGATKILITPRSGRDGDSSDLGNDEHKLPLTLGTGNAHYIESSLFSGLVDGQVIPGNYGFDATAGTRFVYRHNTLIDREVGTHGVQWSRGLMSFEIYENDITDGDRSWVPIHIRSGTGVIFNNKMHGFVHGSNIINVYNDRSTGIGDFGDCDGTSVVDGNRSGENGYPCLDQPGWTEDLGSGNALKQRVEQKLSPIYIWNNYDDKARTYTKMVQHYSMPFPHIQENREFFNETVRPGYVPYPYPHPLTLIDATSGIEVPVPPQQDSYTIQVIKTGQGVVTGTGINCGTDCLEVLNNGTAVTLNATPSAGYTFAGWSGACTGVGSCSVTMNSNKSVTATFNQSTITDTVKPTVAITSPTGGTVANSVTISANASDNVGVAGVQFKLNGNNLGAEDTIAPYALTWNTKTSLNGSYTLTAVARDVAGNSQVSAPVTVNIINVLPDLIAPSTPGNFTATLSSPTAVSLSWSASTDNIGVTGYRIFRDGIVLNTTTNTTYADANLTPGVKYTYTVAAYDAENNVSLHTEAREINTPDTLAPVVSGINALNITANSAKIIWTTNEPATTQVSYGPTETMTASTILDSKLETSHSVSLVGLTGETKYYYAVKSTDASGNQKISQTLSFTTLKPVVVDTVPPVVSNLSTSGNIVGNIKISLNTNEPTIVRVAYGKSSNSLSQTQVSNDLSTSHSVGLDNLDRSSTYYYRVEVTDAAGNRTVSEIGTFTTSARLEKPPKVTGLRARSGSVILSWRVPSYEFISRIVIMRDERSYPDTINEGTKVADLSRSVDTYIDSGAQIDKTYRYSVFTIDDHGVASDPAHIAFKPEKRPAILPDATPATVPLADNTPQVNVVSNTTYTNTTVPRTSSILNFFRPRPTEQAPNIDYIDAEAPEYVFEGYGKLLKDVTIDFIKNVIERIKRGTIEMREILMGTR